MHLVRTLSTLALAGSCLPALHALSIKDDVLSLGLGVRLQTRAQVSAATDANGDDYNVSRGQLDTANDAIDFSMRRTRLYLNVKYGDDWKGQLAIASDNVDAQGPGGVPSSNRQVQVRYAWLERMFKAGELVHGIHLGLDKPYISHATMSSSRELFPTGRPWSDVGFTPRGVGVGYRLTAPILTFAADVQNNINSRAAAGTDEYRDESEGLLYSARVEFSFAPEWMPKQRSESYVGKEGRHFVIGLEYGADQGNLAVVEQTRDTTTVGADVLFHWHAITAMAGYRRLNTRIDAVAGAEVSDIDGEIIDFQVGYALPLGARHVIEPAVRYALIDLNGDVDETPNYGAAAADVGSSGTQLDLGLNLYFDGHSNKLQLAYQHWEAEEGEADADIIRLQHQLNF